MRYLLQIQQRLLAANVLRMVLVVTFWQTASADTLPVAGPLNSLHGGAWALQFAIIGKDLSAFDGGTVSLKHHLSPASALHLGLSYTASIDDRDERLLYPWGGTFERHTDAWEYSFDASLVYVYYPATSGVVAPFLAIGPRGGRSARKTRSVYEGSSLSDPIGSKVYSWRGGISGSVGVECFPTRRIGLLAEYRTSFEYQSSKSWSFGEVDGKDYRIGPLRTTQRALFGSDAVRFGLSLYF